jgi:hypothetical protein
MCGVGRRNIESLLGTGGGKSSAADIERQDGPARFSKKPASGTEWKLGRVRRRGGEPGGRGRLGLAEWDGMMAIASTLGGDPVPFAATCIPHVLGSGNVAQHHLGMVAWSMRSRVRVH